jgi:hypothetical protein
MFLSLVNSLLVMVIAGAFSGLLSEKQPTVVRKCQATAGLLKLEKV